MNAPMTVMTAPQTEQITLYYREGASDKVYQAALEPSGEGFVVNFAYGRRGATLNTGSKTSSAVDYDTAKLIFDKLVREKMAKGYTPGENGTPYTHTDKEQRTTGILPQLLNPIEDHEVARFLKDPNWCMQEKKDGKRVLLQRKGTAITGINRKGLVIGLPSPILEEAMEIPGDLVMDGECVGETFYAFDLVELEGESFRSRQYQDRLAALKCVLDSSEHPHLELILTVFDVGHKTLFFPTLEKGQAEGVVFKRLDAPYTPGRPARGGTQVKYKFYATLSAVIGKVNAQRSVGLELFGDRGWVQSGNVTVPANHPVPAVGAIVDVRYLYAFRESGCLYQPTYCGVRTDLDRHDCCTSQLKFKSSEEEDEG